MIEVADIFRLHGPSYVAQHGLLPSERKVMQDLLCCRTAACGGHLYRCESCGYEHYSYHSCKNRHCPKCQGEQSARWLEGQQRRLLPCAYYLFTFTLPAELRPVARAQPKAIYNLLMTSAAHALQKLAWDPNYVGGQLGMMAILHTWTRAMLYHPHVHLLVAAGGVSRDGQRWVQPKHPAFLVPGFALSPIFRGKFRTGIRKLSLANGLPPQLWTQPWNVHVRHAGSGEKVLGYLARYALRVAISNSRIERLENGQVTFRYRDNRTQHLQHVTLSATEFIGRFLLHVLPKGFVKIRSYGLWSSPCADKLRRVRALLLSTSQNSPAPATEFSNDSTAPACAATPMLCPKCKVGHLIWIQEIFPHATRGP
jgi:hypothetical protein